MLEAVKRAVGGPKRQSPLEQAQAELAKAREQHAEARQRFMGGDDAAADEVRRWELHIERAEKRVSDVQAEIDNAKQAKLQREINELETKIAPDVVAKRIEPHTERLTTALREAAAAIEAIKSVNADEYETVQRILALKRELGTPFDNRDASRLHAAQVTGLGRVASAIGAARRGVGADKLVDIARTL